MAMGRVEKKFWQSIQRSPLSGRQDLIIDRIETGLTVRGMPDTNWCLNGHGDIWVELKVVTSGFKVNISSPQAKWHTIRRGLGSVTWFMIKDLPRDRILLYNGDLATELCRIGLRLHPDREFKREGKSFNWNKIVEALFNL